MDSLDNDPYLVVTKQFTECLNTISAASEADQKGWLSAFLKTLPGGRKRWVRDLKFVLACAWHNESRRGTFDPREFTMQWEALKRDSDYECSHWPDYAYSFFAQQILLWSGWSDRITPHEDLGQEIIDFIVQVNGHINEPYAQYWGYVYRQLNMPVPAFARSGPNGCGATTALFCLLAAVLAGLFAFTSI